MFVIWIHPRFKISWLVMRSISFVIFSKWSLSIFKSLFLRCCSLHITVLQCPLIRSSSCISRCHNALKSLWEIIHLKRKMWHSIHMVRLSRLRVLLPNYLLIFDIILLKKNSAVPVAFNINFIYLLFALLNENISFKLVWFIWKPTSSFKFYNALFVRFV